MEAKYPNTSSLAADEGTAAHALHEWALTNNQDPLDFARMVSETIQVDRNVFPVKGEMEEAIARSVAIANEIAGAEGQKYVEVGLDISHLTGVEVDIGTADLVIILPDEVVVFDLKYGASPKGKVDAEKNDQLLGYASGVIVWMIAAGYDEDTLAAMRFRLVISQPRLKHVSEWTVSYSDIVDWWHDTRARADIAMDLYRRRESVIRQREDGTLELTPEAAAMASPSAKVCQWCKAKADCPKAAEMIRGAIGGQIAPGAYDAAQDGDVTLGQKWLALEYIKDWVKAVEAEVHRRNMAGDTVPGTKVVLGNEGHRKWSDPAKVESYMKDMWRMRDELVYDRTLKSPTEILDLDDLIKHQRRRDKLLPLVTRNPRKPITVADTDPRPEHYIPKALELAFESLAPEPEVPTNAVQLTVEDIL